MSNPPPVFLAQSPALSADLLVLPTQLGSGGCAQEVPCFGKQVVSR